ncbi:WD repeat-containing protein 88 [Discoglossus pictus]
METEDSGSVGLHSKGSCEKAAASMKEDGGHGEEATWDSERLAKVPYKVFRGHTDAVTSCHFCFEDTKILSCSHDRTAKLWDVSKSSPLHVFGDEHTAPISECSLTADNTRMVTSSYDKTVKVWDMETGKVIWSVDLEGLVTSCDISKDGKHVVCSLDVQNSLSIMDSATASRVARLKDHHASTITRCCFDPESQRVCSVSSDCSIKLWDMVAKSTTIKINQAHTNLISDCTFSQNGRLLCTASWDKCLKMWDVNSGEFRHRGPDVFHKVHTGSVSSCAFAKDVSVLVSGGYDKTIVLWDVDSAYKKLVLKGHDDWVLDVAISSNKKRILSSSKDCTLRLWNIENYEQIPAVIENNRVIGSRIIQCEDCEKPFSSQQLDDPRGSNRCVFCRLASPARNICPLPPVP